MAMGGANSVPFIPLMQHPGAEAMRGGMQPTAVSAQDDRRWPGAAAGPGGIVSGRAETHAGPGAAAIKATASAKALAAERQALEMLHKRADTAVEVQGAFE